MDSLRGKWLFCTLHVFGLTGALIRSCFGVQAASASAGVCKMTLKVPNRLQQNAACKWPCHARGTNWTENVCRRSRYLPSSHQSRSWQVVSIRAVTGLPIITLWHYCSFLDRAINMENTSKNGPSYSRIPGKRAGERSRFFRCCCSLSTQYYVPNIESICLVTWIIRRQSGQQADVNFYLARSLSRSYHFHVHRSLAIPAERNFHD